MKKVISSLLLLFLILSVSLLSSCSLIFPFRSFLNAPADITDQGEPNEPDFPYEPDYPDEPDDPDEPDEPDYPDTPPTQTPAPANRINASAAQPLNLQTVTLSTADFSMQAPNGWNYLLSNTANAEFGILLYDPQKPERRIFYHYALLPFLKSEAAHNLFNSIYGSTSYFGACPYLDPPTVECFYSKWNEYVDYNVLFGNNVPLSSFSEMNILEQSYLPTPLSQVASDSAVLHAQVMLTDSSLPCEALLAGTPVSLGTLYQGNVDCGLISVYNVMGIIAPADEFGELEEVLASCLNSFTFTESFVNRHIQAGTDATNAILQNSRAMSDAYSSYNSAWNNRQKTYDTISQKRSDATLGYDRLYDSSTGEIYRTESGWYDQYNLNRESYDNSNLYLVPADDAEKYSQGIDYYIYK